MSGFGKSNNSFKSNFNGGSGIFNDFGSFGNNNTNNNNDNNSWNIDWGNNNVFNYSNVPNHVSLWNQTWYEQKIKWNTSAIKINNKWIIKCNGVINQTKYQDEIILNPQKIGWGKRMGGNKTSTGQIVKYLNNNTNNIVLTVVWDSKNIDWIAKSCAENPCIFGIHCECLKIHHVKDLLHLLENHQRYYINTNNIIYTIDSIKKELMVHMRLFNICDILKIIPKLSKLNCNDDERKTIMDTITIFLNDNYHKLNDDQKTQY